MNFWDIFKAGPRDTEEEQDLKAKNREGRFREPPVYVGGPERTDQNGYVLYSVYQLVCPMCGGLVKRADNFCPKCGNVLKDEEERIVIEKNKEEIEDGKTADNTEE